MSLEIAEESIKQMGFVVVKYKREAIPAIGHQTMYLWQVTRSPQPFIVLREATEQEWQQQRRIAHAIIGREPLDHPMDGIPFVLVSD